MPKFPSDPAAIDKLVQGVAAENKRILFRAKNGKVVALIGEDDLETLEDSDDAVYLEKLYSDPNREAPIPLEVMEKEWA